MFMINYSHYVLIYNLLFILDLRIVQSLTHILEQWHLCLLLMFILGILKVMEVQEEAVIM